MRKARRKMPKGICQREDGRFQGRFTFEGKRYTLYDTDLDALGKKMTDYKYKLAHNILEKGSNITLDQWFDIWMTEYKIGIVKNSTVLLYSLNYDRYIRKEIGSIRMKEIKTFHIQKLFNNIKKKGLSLGTVQIVKRILNNLFSQGIKSEIIYKNPCYGTVITKEEKKKPRVLTKEEQILFRKALQGNFYENLCLLALATGLRIGELTGLKWEDIDFKNHTITIERTLLYQKDFISGKNRFFCQTPKSTLSKREIPMISEVEIILKEHRKIQEDLTLSRGDLWKPMEEMENLVFTTRNGTPIQEVYIVKALRKVTNLMNEMEEIKAIEKKKNPIVHENITPHTLRHTFATRAFENGMTAKTVQEILGHANLSITMDLYTHVTLEQKRQEMRKMAGILK